MPDEYSKALQVRGYSIHVPLPQAYILHKRLINEQRSETNQENDLGAVRDILAAMHGFLAELSQGSSAENFYKDDDLHKKE